VDRRHQTRRPSPDDTNLRMHDFTILPFILRPRATANGKS
jgi:hypothetical protein